MSKIKCEMCDKEFKMITKQHLQKCSEITLDEYKERFPEAQITTQELKDYRIKNCKNMKDKMKDVICSKCGGDMKTSLVNGWKFICDNCRKAKTYEGKEYLEDEDKVVCQICWKAFDRITYTHMKLHDITVDEYIKMFPGVKTHNKRLLKMLANNAKNMEWTEEIRNKLSNSQSFSLKDWQEKYPFFASIEELREDPITGEIQGHCKNHNCKNSKEQGGWFILTKTQLSERIRSLEHQRGNDGSYFYCCDECKQQCPLFGLHTDPYTLMDINTIPLDSEKGIWRQEVLKRQKDKLGHNECEYCGNKNLSILQVHHEKPQKTHSIMAIDPDNGIIACGPENKNCHIKFGHKTGTECSTGNLAKIICS